MKVRMMTGSLLAALAVSAVEMPLEWNETYGTDVPYEVELSPAKLAKLAGVGKGSGFTVRADGKPIASTAFPGKAPQTVDLRFAVPAGTKRLSCEAGTGRLALGDSSKIDNLFEGALDAANVGRWSMGKSVKATPEAGGILFETTDFVDGAKVTYTVDLPEGLAGRPAKVEFDVTSRTKMVWGGAIKVRQVDAAGNDLPECVSDPRWTSQMRPFNKLTCYREDGVFHPRARKLRLEIWLRSVRREVDEYGMPHKGPDGQLAQLLVSRVAVRPAAILPFPKYDDEFFPAGVSGAAGDTALRLGGKYQCGFWYQTHSQACWAEGFSFRDEKDCFFPTGAGTVEAWFLADWKAQREAKVTFFHYHQGYVASERRQGNGAFLLLAWNRDKGELSLSLKDAGMRDFSGKAKVSLPAGTWFHVAAQWKPGAEAQVFVDGKKALVVDLVDFKPFDIADKSIEHPNDLAGMEFFLGCSSHERMRSGGDCAAIEGAVDAFRVSTGCRYDGDFAPAKDLGPVDGDTRARFDFNRSFDGVSGGGAGFILGSYHADSDRIDHRLKVKAEGEERTVQYFPAEILPEADPFQVLDIRNYKVLPKPSEYTAARRDVRRSFDMKPGDTVKYDCPAGAYPDYVEVANTGAKPLVYPLAIGKGELDVRSFGDLADGLSLGDASDRAKANRLFQLVISGSDYFMNHNTIFPYGSDTPKQVCYDAMVVFNSYCGFECGPLNNMTANMFATVAGLPAVQTGGYGHSFEEVFYDGKNHIYDLSAQKFFPAMDNESAAYLREVGDQPAVHNRVKQSADHFIRKGTRGHWVQSPDYREKIGVVLNPGEAFRVWRGNNGQGNNLQCKHPYGRKFAWDEPGCPTWAPRYEKETGAKEAKSPIRRIDRFFPDFSNGFITFDGRPAKDNPAFVNVNASSFCYNVKSGYPITWARYGAHTADGSAAKLEISTDFKTFRELPAPGADGATTLDYLVRARHGYWIRVNAPIESVKRFEAATEVIVNRRTFPGHAKPGANELTLKAASGDRARVTVQWRENVKDVRIAGGAFSGTIPGFERQTVLLDPAKPQALKVTGASSAAKAVATAGLTATLQGGVLTVGAADPKAEPFTGAVTISDGDANRELTVIVCAGARMALAKDGALTGAAEAVAPDADRVQDAAMLRKRGDGVTLRFDPLPAGKYLVFSCQRFEGGLVKGENGARVVEFKVPGRKAKDAWQPIAAAANGNFDFLKAPYGVKGSRGNWKWDYVYLQDARSSSWSGWEMMQVDFAATDTLSFQLGADRPNGVELAGALVFPASVSHDFRADLKKILCGLDCQPVRIVRK